MKTLAKYVTFSIAVLLIYTAVEFFASAKTGVTHDTLTTCMFAFFGTEIGSCCLIQIVKTRHGSDNQSDSDTQSDIEIMDLDQLMTDKTGGGVG